MQTIVANPSGEFTPVKLTAPTTIGEQVWTISLADAAKGSDADAGSTVEPLRIALCAVPITTSMAAWGIPDFVVTRETFTVTVGAKSAAAHPVRGEAVEVCDEAGTPIGRGVLSDAPLEGTDALYWCEIGLAAPLEPGLRSWSARFAADRLGLPHESSKCTFSIMTTMPAEHAVTVTVRESKSGAPVNGMLVRLGAQRAITDEAGVAVVQSWSGPQDLAVWHAGFRAPPQALDVTKDMTVQVAVETVPEEDPDAPWKM
jgi:hypothetical protein